MKAFGKHEFLINLNLRQALVFIGKDRNTYSKSFGFTIIELIIVLAIMGIIAAIASPVYVGYQTRARNGAAISDLVEISLRLDSYVGDNDIGPHLLRKFTVKTISIRGGVLTSTSI